MLNLTSTSGGEKIPRHLAIIMDGNGRWAKKRGMPRLMGHRQGAKAVTRTVEAAAQKGISILTLFAFSSENWKRPAEEVSGLMDLFAKVLVSERDNLHKNGIKVLFVGDLSRLSLKLQSAIASIEQLTEHNERMLLQIAVNYGGRWDIVQAAKQIAQKVQEGSLDIGSLDDASFKQYLSVGDDVDLLIRTGGEYRISNFLLYQCAYSELYVTDTLWPDFDSEQMQKAIDYFSSRERRFGMISEQLKS